MSQEHRYVIFKLEDVARYLSVEERNQLARLNETVAAGRQADKKIPLKCVVVESDRPAYARVWGLLANECPPMLDAQAVYDRIPYFRELKV